MTLLKIGLVRYTDTGEVFRIVYPTKDDSELDDPQWTTVGVDPARSCELIRIDQEKILDVSGFGPILDGLVAKVLAA